MSEKEPDYFPFNAGTIPSNISLTLQIWHKSELTCQQAFAYVQYISTMFFQSNIHPVLALVSVSAHSWGKNPALQLQNAAWCSRYEQPEYEETVSVSLSLSLASMWGSNQGSESGLGLQALMVPLRI